MRGCADPRTGRRSARISSAGRPIGTPSERGWAVADKHKDCIREVRFLPDVLRALDLYTHGNKAQFDQLINGIVKEKIGVVADEKAEK